MGHKTFLFYNLHKCCKNINFVVLTILVLLIRLRKYVSKTFWDAFT